MGVGRDPIFVLAVREQGGPIRTAVLLVIAVMVILYFVYGNRLTI